MSFIFRGVFISSVDVRDVSCFFVLVSIEKKRKSVVAATENVVTCVSTSKLIAYEKDVIVSRPVLGDIDLRDSAEPG